VLHLLVQPAPLIREFYHKFRHLLLFFRLGHNPLGSV
jgi:hypothetical protein